MGAFNILKRFRSAPAPAEASTATDKAATATAAGRASSKSKKPSRTVHSDSDAVASGAANPTVSVPVSAVAPRVDLSILRSPSPPLVDVPLEGYRDNSPWVDLAADVEPPRRGSFGFRYLASTSSPTSREVSQKLKSYLDDKRITPAQANVLVRECLKALQGQGLETLGIFRPWRLSESQYIIARTLALYLKAVCPDDNIPLEDRDLLGFSRDEDALTAFTEALQDAGTHNVVACLKWGLRHLYSTPPGVPDSLCDDPWLVHRLLLRHEHAIKYDGSAYSKVWRDKLPAQHGELVASFLSLAAAVAVHDAENAMPGLHLCRLMATWLFGRQQKTWSSWEELYKDYLQAAACLEHVFLSQLRTETNSLPLRLKQLVTPYPLEKLALTENNCETRILRLEDWDALHIILLGPAGAASEVAQTSRWSPATILATALKANYQEGVDETLRAAWSALSESSAMKQDEGHESRNIIVDETKRIFDLVAERAEKKNRFRFTTETRFPAYGHNYGNRRRSVSIDVGMMQSTSSKSSASSGRNRALSNDARMTASPSQPFDISWGDFETKGFSDEFDSDTFSLFSEVGRPSMDENTTTSQQQRPQKLKKPYPYASLASKQLHSEAMYRGGLGIEHDEQLAAYQIQKIRKVKIDPIFSEMYLDSLEDPNTVIGWPNFMVAELKDRNGPYRAVIIELVKSDPPISEPEIVHPSTSMTSIPQLSIQSNTKQKQRRSLFSLSSRKKRHSTVTGTKGKVASKAEGNLAHISELGVWTPAAPSQAASDTASDKHGAKRVRQEGPSRLPMQIRSQTVPIIVKTSPLTPPRRYMNDVVDRASPAAAPPAKHAEIAHQSSPSPSGTAASLEKKVSRKAVPELVDEDVFLAEVSKEAVNPDNRQDFQQEGLASAIADATDHQSQQSETADAELVHPMEPIRTMGIDETSFEDASPVLMTEAPVTLEMVCQDTFATDAADEAGVNQPERTDDKEHVSSKSDTEASSDSVPATPSEHVENSHTGNMQDLRASSEPALKQEMVIPTVVIEDADPQEESSIMEKNAPNAMDVIGESQDARRDVSSLNNVDGASNDDDVEPVTEVSQVVDTPLMADEHSYPSPAGLPSTIELREEVDDETETADFIEAEDQKVGRGDNLAQAPLTEETLAADATEPAEEPRRNAEEPESLTELNYVSDLGQSPNAPEPVLDGSGEESGIAQSKAEDAENQPYSASSTPKRFGSTLNRVSPSLKERFSSGKSQVSPEQDKPGDKTPKPQAPPSPSRRAALLSGAKKMLSRKKSNPSGIGAVLPPSPDPVPPIPEQTAGQASAEPAAVHQHPNLQYAMNTVHVNPDELSGSSADDPLLNEVADEEQRSRATAVATSTDLHIPNSYGEDQLVAASSPNIDVLPLLIPSVLPVVPESGDVGTRAPNEDSSSNVDQEMQITNDVKSIDDVAETQEVTDVSDDEGSSQEPMVSVRSTAVPGSTLQRTTISDSDGPFSTAKTPLREEAAVAEVEGMPEPEPNEAGSEKRHRKSSTGIDTVNDTQLSQDVEKVRASSEELSTLHDDKVSVNDTQHQEPSPVLPPTSRVLAAAQDTAVSAVTSLSTLAASVLPTSLTDAASTPPKKNTSEPADEQQHEKGQPASRSAPTPEEKASADPQGSQDLVSETQDSSVADAVATAANSHSPRFGSPAEIPAIPAKTEDDERVSEAERPSNNLENRGLANTGIESSGLDSVLVLENNAKAPTKVGVLGSEPQYQELNDAEPTRENRDEIKHAEEAGSEIEPTNSQSEALTEDLDSEVARNPIVNMTSPAQHEPTASITTSPISGLPMRTSETISVTDEEEGHSAFHKAEALPNSQDIQPENVQDAAAEKEIRNPDLEDDNEALNTPIGHLASLEPTEYDDLPEEDPAMSSTEPIQESQNATIQTKEPSIEETEGRIMAHSSSTGPPRSKDQETLKEDPGKTSSVDNDNRSTGPAGGVQPRNAEARNTTLADSETPEKVESIQWPLTPEHLLQEIEARKEKLGPHTRKDDDESSTAATGVAHDAVEADAAATPREQAEGEKSHGIAAPERFAEVRHSNFIR